MSCEVTPMLADSLLEVCAPVNPADLAPGTAFQARLQDVLKFYENLPAVGLAAPQIGWNVRLFIIGFDNDSRDKENNPGMVTKVYINPSWEPLSDEKEGEWEGCFSIACQHHHISGQVQRYKHIRYSALTAQGELMQGTLHGFHARVFQHECDHLDGVRYVNRMHDIAELNWYHKINRSEFNVRMQHLPKTLLRNEFHEMMQLIPVLTKASTSGLSANLLEAIARAYTSALKKYGP